MLCIIPFTHQAYKTTFIQALIHAYPSNDGTQSHIIESHNIDDTLGDTSAVPLLLVTPESHLKEDAFEQFEAGVAFLRPTERGERERVVRVLILAGVHVLPETQRRYRLAECEVR